MNDYHWSTRVTTWTKEKVEDLRNYFRSGELSGAYGINNTKKIERHLNEHMADTIKGKQLLKYQRRKSKGG
jgi:hypothetical protein